MKNVKIYQLKRVSKTTKDLIFAGFRESALVWNFCSENHKKKREKREAWPRKKELQELTRKQYKLHSQSVQMVCHAFLANIDTAIKLRKTNKKIRLPYREKYFYPLLWPKQAASYINGFLILPMGRERKSISIKVDIDPSHIGSCKIVFKEELELHVVIEKEEVEKKENGPDCFATIDLGQIHLGAVTAETKNALVLSGRGIRSLKRGHSKSLGKLAKKQVRCKTGSRRYKKIQRAKRRLKARNKRRVRDLRHKGTTKIIDFCKNQKVTKIFVGDPSGVRKHKCGRHHNQRISQWEFGKDLSYLEYKAKKAGIMCFNGTERGTSSCCPECSYRKKVRSRVWKCPRCNFICHRDIVGTMNMFPIAFGKKIEKPEQITYLRPGSLRTTLSSSSLGTGQSSLAKLQKHHQQKSFCVV